MSVTPKVVSQSYGKSQVRVSRIHREGKRHEFIEVTVWIELDGQFETSYSEADNSLVVPTDTMKNTVYVLAARHGIKSIEVFAEHLGQHFLATYAHVNHALLRCEQTIWSRMLLNGKPHDHSFIGGGSEHNTCQISAIRTTGGAKLELQSGIAGLQVLKTTESGFVNYLRDAYTTLQPTEDRIFATAVAANWPCHEVDADWTKARQTIRAALLDVFANQYSKSVQQTLFEMARSAFAACSLIDEITIRMPNQHHLLVNIAPFGMQNANEVFVPTSEPFGNISATIARGDTQSKT
ncbi:MAG TPA: urate oxidase [Pirellulales bacterium]